MDRHMKPRAPRFKGQYCKHYSAEDCAKFYYSHANIKCDNCLVAEWVSDYSCDTCRLMTSNEFGMICEKNHAHLRGDNPQRTEPCLKFDWKDSIAIYDANKEEITSASPHDRQ